MSMPTTGLELRRGPRALREAVELVSSMRFSISLLTLIGIASVIGTVVKQHEPYTSYVNQFGPFWAQVFGAAGLYAVYSAWWFVLILGFLVLSTSLCVARNAPKIVADLRNYKEGVREQSLDAFHLRARGELREAPDAVLERIAALLGRAGWKARVQRRVEGGGALRGLMVAARHGAANKLGYIAAHSSIVLICVGGLADGDLAVRAQMALLGKSAFPGSGLFRDIGAEHRLGPGNPTFRGNLHVPEGTRSATAVIAMADGVVLQELPFDVELRKFIVDYYETGMPKLFASEIVIHDHASGESRAATVKVNEPAFHRGVAIYQSSFDDGGSKLKLRAWPLAAGAPVELEGVVGSSGPLGAAAAAPTTIEYTGLRVINVENLGKPAGPTDVRRVDLAGALRQHLGTAAKGEAQQTLRNVGPSFSYKLRDASGQAREFNNYMLPVEIDGQRLFLAGMRESPDEPYRYVRIPADDAGELAGWVRLRQALLDPALREAAARRYADYATPADKPTMTPQLLATAQRVLAMFAGVEPGKPGAAAAGGLVAISDFLEDSVPANDRERVSQVLLRILNGSLYELLNLSRERAGAAPLAPDAATQGFMTHAVLSLADSFYYPAPVLVALADFQHVQASVFQVARTPGKLLVYAGAVLLIVGVFAMLYIRERRLWIWLEPLAPTAASGAGTRVAMALSTTRRTLDADREFDRLRRELLRDTA